MKSFLLGSHVKRGGLVLKSGDQNTVIKIAEEDVFPKFRKPEFQASEWEIG